MIDYNLIYLNDMFGTMKFCIKNFPEDFKDPGVLYKACTMGNLNVHIIPLLNENPCVDKSTLYAHAINQPCITHYLLRKNFFKPNIEICNHELESAFRFYVKFGCSIPDTRNKNIKEFIRKILKPRLHINADTIEKYYNNLPNELKKYFLKTIPFKDNFEDTLEMIRNVSDYDFINNFIRICKPTLDWTKLIHVIDSQDFYKIIAITNSMKHYKKITDSYETIYNNNQKTIPKQYSKSIQDYLKSYTESTQYDPLLSISSQYIVYNSISTTGTADFIINQIIE